EYMLAEAASAHHRGYERISYFRETWTGDMAAIITEDIELLTAAEAALGSTESHARGPVVARLAEWMGRPLPGAENQWEIADTSENLALAGRAVDIASR